MVHDSNTRRTKISISSILQLSTIWTMRVTMLPYIHTSKSFHIYTIQKASIYTHFKKLPYMHTLKSFHIYTLQKASIYTHFKKLPYIPTSKSFHICTLQNASIYTHFRKLGALTDVKLFWLITWRTVGGSSGSVWFVVRLVLPAVGSIINGHDVYNNFLKQNHDTIYISQEYITRDPSLEHVYLIS